MNRIRKLFEKTRKEGRGAFVAYLTMGSPTLAESVKAAKTLLSNGADILELGVPFSDPMADGAVIRKAAGVALANGTNLAAILESVKDIRASFPEAPLVIFSYYNVIFHYGLEKFAKDASAAGADALLAVDVSLEDRDEVVDVLKPNGLAFIPLVAPTTPIERVKEIAKGMEDAFLYVVTVNGTTGARVSLPPEVATRLTEIKKVVKDVPVCAGFGVSTREQVAMLSSVADGYVVGSAIVKLTEAEDAERALADFAKNLTGRE